MPRWLLALALLCGCRDEAGTVQLTDTFATPFSAQEAPDFARARTRALRPSFDTALAPLPQRLALDARKVALGARLFRERRLSGDGKVACYDCHALERGGANGQARSKLPGRTTGPVNVPSVFNAAFNFRFGWGGGFEDIGEQIDFAMGAASAMHGSWPDAARALARDAELRGAFAAIYADGLTGPNLREALAVYSLSLITPNSRFDRYLRGELALSADEQRGYDLFRDHGCVSCHQGINIGGNMLQRFGIVHDYFAQRGALEPADLGLFNHSAREEDRYVFRVPSLRNVALTAPYFHDASASTLEQAATIMARYQLGRELTHTQAAQIAAFLRSLTGELNGRPL